MSRPPSGLWDDAVAAEIIGKTVLVGMSYPAQADAPERHEQFHGVVVRAEPGQGILLDLAGSRAGEQRLLPAATSALVPAAPGVYRLRATGEDVVDPDYISTWTVQPPAG